MEKAGPVSEIVKALAPINMQMFIPSCEMLATSSAAVPQKEFSVSPKKGQSKEAAEGNQHKLIGMHMLEMGLLSTSELIEILRVYESK